MSRAFKILAFQASAIAAGVLMMGVVADMARAAPPVPPTAVTIGNFTFNSPTLTVKPGTTVTWTNADDIPHTVVSKDGIFKSKVLDTGDRFSFTFAKAGQFGYYCSLHPHMTGIVTVKA
ncbi:MAG: cupredoxin family copper-binding protein [Sphingomicrobium sp.]